MFRKQKAGQWVWSTGERAGGGLGTEAGSGLESWRPNEMGVGGPQTRKQHDLNFTRITLAGLKADES